MSILKNSFFNREADVVAEDLIGAFLCFKGKKFKITETEAYMGPHDLASHSSKGKTKRTEPMFMEPGTIYVYLVYGMYEMLNIVTREEGYPAAVLIRGIEGYSGPGKLTKGLGITRDLNKKKVGESLWFEGKKEEKSVKKSPRIGVNYSKEWKDKKLRFHT